MLSDIIKQLIEGRDKFLHGFNSMQEFLEHNIHSKEIKNDPRAKTLLARMEYLLDNSTIMEDLGQDFAWIGYRICYPIKMYRWLNKI